MYARDWPGTGGSEAVGAAAAGEGGERGSLEKEAIDVVVEQLAAVEKQG